MNDARNDYELLDFGEGRKLERFGKVVVNRPSPPAEGLVKKWPEKWAGASARFRGPRTGDGSWTPAPTKWQPADWHIIHRGAASFRLELEALPSGQVGVFPEQSQNWDWIAKQVLKAKAVKGRPPRVLNLFAYTGASTLAAAGAGAEVVHIDAARNMVERARRNAE